MSQINAKRVVPMARAQELKDSHLNFMGGHSWNPDNPLTVLKSVTASCFFGEPQYYLDAKSKPRDYSFQNTIMPQLVNLIASHNRQQLGRDINGQFIGKTPAEVLTLVIDNALKFNPQATLDWAVTLRTEENIRTTPQVILVRAAMMPELKGTGLIRRYAKKITKRMDEPAVQLAYFLSTYPDKPIPNGLKRAWKDILENATDYQLAKYSMKNRMVKTVDVANLAYGGKLKGFDKPIGSLLRGELTLGGDNETWESLTSRFGSNKKSWTAAVQCMGHMALLRNIVNLCKHNVPKYLWVPKLIATSADGKQLPFRYWMAYQMASEIPTDNLGYVLDAIEECLELSIGNLPKIEGRSLVLADNSGSARGAGPSGYSKVKMSNIGNMMGVMTARVSDMCEFAVFGDRLTYVPIRQKSSVFDTLKMANMAGCCVGESTEHGIWLALDKIIRKNEVYDSIFIYSDMQAGHGGLYGIGTPYPVMKGLAVNAIDVPLLINKYRKTVNPNVDVFLVQIAGYADTIIPEYYDRTYIIGGWSDSILRFAASMKAMRNQQQ